MSPSPAKGPAWHWTDYWQSGRTEVMTVDKTQGRVPFETEAIWREFFGRFDDGARLLDLATGAGQVARYAAATGTAAGKRFEVVGVDYAHLGPTIEPPPPECQLIGGVALEALPFEAATFDGASSQYGIEYADTRLALSELARVLKPQAPALMLIHHADSAVTRSAADQSRAYDQVFGDMRVLKAARRVFIAHAEGRPPDALAEAEGAFRDAVGRMASRLKPERAYEPVRYLVGYLENLAARAAAYVPKSALDQLDSFEAGGAAWRQRHRSQLRSALDANGLAAFLHRADRSGLAAVEHGELHDGQGQLLAWKVELQRR